MVMKVLVASAAVFAGKMLLDNFVFKSGPDDPKGFIMQDPNGLGLDDAVFALGIGVAVVAALSLVGPKS